MKKVLTAEHAAGRGEPSIVDGKRRTDQEPGTGGLAAITPQQGMAASEHRPQSQNTCGLYSRVARTFGSTYPLLAFRVICAILLPCS